MIRRHGARTWNNIHLTKKAKLADLIDVDNSAPGAVMPTGFAVLKQTADAFDSLASGGCAAFCARQRCSCSECRPHLCRTFHSGTSYD